MKKLNNKIFNSINQKSLYLIIENIIYLYQPERLVINQQKNTCFQKISLINKLHKDNKINSKKQNLIQIKKILKMTKNKTKMNFNKKSI